MAANDVSVRVATREDMPAILQMIHDLAQFEGMPEGPQLTVEDLVSDGFEQSPAWFLCWVAERGGRVVGHALCNRAYSSWTRRALYIEDLYVQPAERGARIGHALLHTIAMWCVREGVTRIDWHVLNSNEGALRFYQRLGARDMLRSEGRAALRLDEPDIRRLAAHTQLPHTSHT